MARVSKNIKVKIDKEEYYKEEYQKWRRMMLVLARNEEYEQVSKMAHTIDSHLGDLRKIHIRNVEVHIDQQVAEASNVSWIYRYQTTNPRTLEKITHTKRFQYFMLDAEIVEFLKKWNQLYVHTIKRAAFCSICGAPVEPITTPSAYPIKPHWIDRSLEIRSFCCEFCDKEVRPIVNKALSMNHTDPVTWRKKTADYDATQIIYDMLTRGITME